LYILNQYYCTY